jgi:2-polyprenyl-6-methoxyphenol hydroxylase-like FAD-dependent oxidoreductase
MTAVSQVLIVGGGVAGMAAAIALGRVGVRAELVEADAQWRVYGAGITLSGATLRACEQLGIFQAVAERGYTSDGICVCDLQGTPLSVLPTPSAVGTRVPGSGGILRPVLHSILGSATQASSTAVRLGVTVQRIEQRADHIEAHFSDGTQGQYDLLIGADGLFSATRVQLFPLAPAPIYTGQCIWRALLPRPPQIDRRHFFLGGPCKVGLNPVSQTHMYLFLLESRPAKHWMAESALPASLRKLLEPYGGVLRAVREALDTQSQIILRPLETFMLPAPWHSGRALLIGDAAHPTTPQLASGAGMAMEDALVLADEVARQATVDEVCRTFMRRRYERCQLVVRNSIEIGRREQAREPIESQTELVAQSLRVLAEPI